MLDAAWVKAINSWVAPDDLGALNQWLDALNKLHPIAKEHGLSLYDAQMLFINLQQLNKLAQIRDLLVEIRDSDMMKGDVPE